VLINAKTRQFSEIEFESVKTCAHGQARQGCTPGQRARFVWRPLSTLGGRARDGRRLHARGENAGKRLDGREGTDLRQERGVEDAGGVLRCATGGGDWTLGDAWGPGNFGRLCQRGAGGVRSERAL
jgi:hypothetical protein